jgi:predicted DNA-binding protein
MKEKALSIRLPVEVYERLSELARQEGRTLNAQANQLLLKGFKRVEQEKEAIRKIDEEDDILPIKQTEERVG